MVKGLFRYLLIGAFLILIFGFGTNAFSATLSDAYGVLIGNGWTAKDALGFLGTSIAGTLAMNPSLAPAVAAGALSAYIGVKGAQLYDIYRDWKNLRTGIAMLNPVEFSQSMAVKKLRKGEYGWGYAYVSVSKSSGTSWNFSMGYVEYYNDNGRVINWWGKGPSGSAPKDVIISSYFNYWLTNYVPLWKDGEGKALFTSIVNTAYNYLIADTAYSAYYSRQVVAALETDPVGGYASTLGYRVNVDPQNISEDGVNYLNDPDAFYQWFVSNYMNGTNEGTFVTPLNETYDEIRTQLETIINQLNNLASTGGGVSEETLNEVKTEILNVMNSRLSGIDTKLSGIDTQLSAVDTKLSGVDSTLTSVSNSLSTLQSDINTNFDSLDSALTGVNTNLDALDSDIASVKTSIDTLTEAQQEEQGFWDRLMEWLDVTLFQKLQELLENLFLPTEEQLDELFDIELPEYEKQFAADVSFSSQNVNIPIRLFGTTVDLSGYIAQYSTTLRTFMNIFVSGIAAIFVIRAFRVYFHID